MDLFKIVNTLGNLILQTNFKEGEQEIMIEVKLINLVLGIDELDDAAFLISLSLGDQITTTLATSVLPVCSEENS